MKKLGKLASLLLAVVMLFSVMSFASADEVPEGYPEIIKDANGNPIDLGGFELVVYDWWSTGVRNENPSKDVEDQYAYQDWLFKTYNFTAVQTTIGSWETNLQTFVDFVNAPDKTENKGYCWFLRNDVVAQPLANNMFYDLATLDSIDLTNEQWNATMIKFMSAGDSVYGTFNGKSQAHEVIYFNYRLLEEAGVDPDELYEMQANDTWTWEAFEEVLKKCIRDTDNDGVTDIWGMSSNMNDMYNIAVFSNGGKYFDYDENGNIVAVMNSDETLEALNWARDFGLKYQQPTPEGNTQWDWFHDNFKAGNAAFMCYQEYVGAYANASLSNMEDDYGCIAFPKGPKGEKLVTTISDNVIVIPNVYDADTAWKIGFALSQWFSPTPGYENIDEAWIAGRLADMRDEGSVDTLIMFREPEHQVMSLVSLLGETNAVLGADFWWSMGGESTPAELIEAKMPAWKTLMDIANGVAVTE